MEHSTTLWVVILIVGFGSTECSRPGVHKEMWGSLQCVAVTECTAVGEIIEKNGVDYYKALRCGFLNTTKPMIWCNSIVHNDRCVPLNECISVVRAINREPGSDSYHHMRSISCGDSQVHTERMVTCTDPFREELIHDNKIFDVPTPKPKECVRTTECKSIANIINNAGKPYTRQVVNYLNAMFCGITEDSETMSLCPDSNDKTK